MDICFFKMDYGLSVSVSRQLAGNPESSRSKPKRENIFNPIKDAGKNMLIIWIILPKTFSLFCVFF